MSSVLDALAPCKEKRAPRLSVGGGELEAQANVEAVPALTVQVHWLLTKANPNWSMKELQSVRGKLKQVGVVSFSELDEVLQEKGKLNNLLREKSLRAFAAPTLDSLRKQIAQEKERQRQTAILTMQRERRRLDDEMRTSIEASTDSSCIESSDLPELDEASHPEDTLGDRTKAQEAVLWCESVGASVNSSCKKPHDSTEREHEVAHGVKAVGDCTPTTQGSSWRADRKSAHEVEAAAIEGECPSRVSIARSILRRTSTSSTCCHSSECCHSWEWPLSRREKTQRVIMCYEKELHSMREEKGIVDE